MHNKDNTLAHEWIGLTARIRKSTCKAMEGISGKIVDETKNTLLLEDAKGREKRIPKKSIVFEIEIAHEQWVEIDGSLVRYAPEDRPKKLLKRLK
ncbi:MAG: ribonuclease P protein subunit [Candidatus Micrarchaeota archaeon]